MRAAWTNSPAPEHRPRDCARQAQGRALVSPASVRTWNPVPPHREQAPSSTSIMEPTPGTAGPARPGAARPCLVQITLQLLAFLRAVQLLQGLRLDLPDALARQAHHLADLLQRLRFPFVEAETQAQDLLFLGVELSQA